MPARPQSLIPAQLDTMAYTKSMERRSLWLIPFLLVTLIFGILYVSVQQLNRQSANDPQIALAQNTAARLDRGDKPTAIVGSDTIDLRSNSSPAVIIYDRNGNPVAGSATINNVLPRIPVGVLTAAKGQAYHTITWQPADDIRLASVTVASKDYFVTAVHSLREVEHRATYLLQLAILGWAGSIFILGVGLRLYRASAAKRTKK
jgi:hypothetical protein